MESIDSREIVDEDTYKMQLEVETGVKFDFFSSSVKMTGGYESQVKSETYHSISKDTSIEYYIECSGDPGAEGGVGLWQFVVSTSDGNLSTLTNHTVCRYGDLYNVAPACPWNVCANGDCSVCKDDWQV